MILRTPYFVAKKNRIDFYAILLINCGMTNVKVLITVDGNVATKGNHNPWRRIIIAIGESTTNRGFNSKRLIITVMSTWIIPANFYDIHVAFYYCTAVGYQTIVYLKTHACPFQSCISKWPIYYERAISSWKNSNGELYTFLVKLLYDIIAA